MFYIQPPLEVATVNATGDEIVAEKATIATRREETLKIAKQSQRDMVSLTTARRAVYMGQLRNTLAFEAMEQSLSGMRAAKIQRDRAKTVWGSK
jgi:predicted dithiol-disulfide oxidoreductase (DUF899 family)